MIFADALLYLSAATYLGVLILSWYIFRTAKLKIIFFFSLGFTMIFLGKLVLVIYGTGAIVYELILDLSASIFFIAGILTA
ncbi:MAG: hypothetical protein ACE5K4_11915 [Candidatus Hydrothermarchaeota archaeon]